MDKTVFESFEDYLEEGITLKEKNHAGSSGLSTRVTMGPSTLHIAERAGLSQATLLKYFFKTMDDLIDGDIL